MRISGSTSASTSSRAGLDWIWFAWHLAAVAFLLLVPSYQLLGEPLYSVSSRRMLFLVGLPACYLAAASLLTLFAYRTGGLRSHQAVLTMASLLGLLYLALLLVPEQTYARRVLLALSVAAVVLIILPVVFVRYRAIGLGMLIASLGGFLALQGRGVALAHDRETGSIAVQVIHTVHGSLRATHHLNHIPRPFASGGALSVIDDRYLLVTGDGVFFVLRWTSGSDPLRVEELGLRVPINSARFIADVPEEVDAATFRVVGLLTKHVGKDTLKIFVSHHHWKSDDECFVLRVSTITVAEVDLFTSVNDKHWTTLYDTQPCLPIKERGQGPRRFAGNHSGGRLAELPSGNLLLTVGDHQFDGWNSDDALPQAEDADYGKTLILGSDGGGRIDVMSMGHRNPQGLHIDPNGKIWLTSHGPQGGDELIDLVPGGNYGWPFQTFGSQYGDVVWPLQGRGAADAVFQSPMFVWVPSIAPTNLISVQGTEYPHWTGDLLVASLRDQALHRVRVRGTRVIYTERLEVGRRIRDLVQGPDGRLVLWVDNGTIVSLTLASAAADGAVVFQQCVACHDVGAGSSHGIGPDLAGIYGRRVASGEVFRYSRALRSIEGRWTEERLDAFLADPAGFAPGTLMEFEGVQDEQARQALIEYLKSL